MFFFVFVCLFDSVVIKFDVLVLISSVIITITVVVTFIIVVIIASSGRSSGLWYWH